MKTAIIIHGRPEKDEYYDTSFPSPSNSHWLPWLQKELLCRDTLTQTPELPRAFAPDYDEWKNIFEQFAVDENTILVGHSRGGGFLLRWLSETKITVGKVVLVAPSILANPGVVTGFSEYNIDPTLESRTTGITVFYSTDDEDGILKSIEKIRSVLPAISFREFSDKGHFTSGDGMDKFPELLAEIEK